MASLDSANGPSATDRPFLPVTILPCGSSGCPPLSLPCWDNRSNQFFHWFITFSISSGDRPRCQSVPRNSNRYSFCVCVFIFFLDLLLEHFAPFSNTTNDRACGGQLFCVFVFSPRAHHGTRTTEHAPRNTHHGTRNTPHASPLTARPK